MQVILRALVRAVTLTLPMVATAFCASIYTNYDSSHPVPVSVSVGVSAPMVGMDAASVTFGRTIILTFAGGQGTGYYVPLLSAIGSHVGEASAQFDGVSIVNYGPGWLRTDWSRTNWIPFVYGEPQIRTFSLHADAQTDAFAPAYARYGSASASLDGFHVMDLYGNAVASATWTAQAVPEPSESMPLLVVLGLSSFHLMRRQSRSTT